MTEQLPNLYHDTKPFSFGGKQRVYEYYPNISKKDIDEKLAFSETFTKYRPFRKLKQTSPVYVFYKRQLFQADLIFFTNKHQIQANDNYCYMLAVIDCFTKMVWLYKMRDKQTTTVIDQFKLLFQECGELPDNLQTDVGGEFDSQSFSSFIKNSGVNHYFAYGDRKCSIIERFNRTIQDIIYAMMDHYNTHKWTKLMADAKQIYINRKHATIKMTPLQAELIENQSKLLKTYHSKYAKFKKKEAKFKVGDYVRIAGLRNKFKRSYFQNYSNEVFQIHSILRNLPTPRYRISNFYGGELIQGTFWPNELVKFNFNDETEWRIEKILDRRKIGKGKRKQTEILVKWLGWPDSYNSWITEKSSRLL